MINDATNYATGKADIFKQSLQYLVDAQNTQRLLDEQSMNKRYGNLVEQINQKRLPIEQQFGQDSQAAYVNKLLGGKKIEGEVSRMGLNSAGYGLTQQAQNETGYGQNYNALMLDRSNKLTGIDSEVTNTQGQQQVDALGLQSTYAGRLGELNQYISESTNNKYNQEYDTFVKNKQYEEQLKQQEYENAIKVKQYEDALKQQAWENDYKNRALNASGSSGSGSSDTLFTADAPIATPTGMFSGAAFNATTTNKTTPTAKAVAPTYNSSAMLTINKEPMGLSSKALTAFRKSKLSTGNGTLTAGEVMSILNAGPYTDAEKNAVLSNMSEAPKTTKAVVTKAPVKAPVKATINTGPKGLYTGRK